MSFINGFWKGQRNFSENIAVIINSILLSIVYFIGIGLTSIIAKIFGVSFLETKPEKNSYWTETDISKNPREDCYRQF